MALKKGLTLGNCQMSHTDFMKDMSFLKDMSLTCLLGDQTCLFTLKTCLMTCLFVSFGVFDQHKCAPACLVSIEGGFQNTGF